MARILITGGGGMLGRAVAAAFSQGHTPLPLTRSELDITDAAAVRAAILEHDPQVLVNCAAMTDVDGCESRHDVAQQVNGMAVGYLGAALGPRALLVHVSTDFVFGEAGTGPFIEEAPTDPLSAYAESKLYGEKCVHSRKGPWLMLRTSWLYGAGGKNFVDTIRAKAKTGEDLRVVNDQRGCPTWTEDLARAIRFLVEKGRTGIYHACGRGEATWFDLAREILDVLGLENTLEPIRSKELDRPATRPWDSRLSVRKLSKEGFDMPEWKDSLRKYLKPEADTEEWAPWLAS